MTVQEVVSKAKKIVVKIGSNTLAKADGKINSLTIQTHLHHKFLYCLMVKKYAIITQLRGYSTIAIASFMTVIYLSDCSSCTVIAVRL